MVSDPYGASVTQLGIHDTQGALGQDGRPIGSDKAVFGPTPVPEPSTVILMATGLIGLAGIGAVRRRREKL